ncbi:hypothetical protein JTB14_009876 [Gonioctena quinquepunctata]|nr:hypothetical protein JTB14_009876 [Gonioctena quinquepunctata]
MEITVSQEPNDSIVNPISRWNTRKAKWRDHEVTSERYFNDNPQLFDSLNDKYQYFIKGIDATASMFIPLNKPPRKGKLPPRPW